MKNLYKAILLIFIVSAYSCELTDLDKQTDPNAVAPETAGLEFVFNNMQLQFSNLAWEASDETMAITRMMAMTGGNTYNNNDSPANFNFIWSRLYSEIMPDAALVIERADPLELYVHSGIAKVMQAYSLMTLVDLFGDVPFSEAAQGVAFQNPQRDDDAEVYNQAKILLEAAIADFAKPNKGTPGNDVIYGGNAAQWTKAANALLIRWHVTTKLAGGSGAEVAALAANSITDAADDFQFNYGNNRSTPDSRHPHFSIDYEADVDYYQSNYFMWSLLEEKGVRDPRLRYYFYRQDSDLSDETNFALDCPGIPRPPHYTGDYPWCVTSMELGYWGRDHGNDDGIPPDGFKRTAFGVYPIGGKFDNDDALCQKEVDADGNLVNLDNCGSVAGDGSDGLKGAGILPLMMSSFVDFMRAEAALTMGSGENAEEMLESGIRKSIGKVMSFGASQANPEFVPTEESVNDYVDLVLGRFSSASNEGKMDIIAKEYHIALFGNGLEAFNLYRRTGYPSNMQPTRDPNSGDFPRTYFYPADHIGLNSNAEQRPTLSEQVFWDTNPANPGWVN